MPYSSLGTTDRRGIPHKLMTTQQHRIFSRKKLCLAAFPLTLGARLPCWQTHTAPFRMPTTQSTTKKQLALAKSPLGHLELVDQQASPLLKLLVGKVPADDGFVVQLACGPLHAIVKERFATSGGSRRWWQGRCRVGGGLARGRAAGVARGMGLHDMLQDCSLWRAGCAQACAGARLTIYVSYIHALPRACVLVPYRASERHITLQPPVLTALEG